MSFKKYGQSAIIFLFSLGILGFSVPVEAGHWGAGFIGGMRATPSSLFNGETSTITWVIDDDEDEVQTCDIEIYIDATSN